jgi:pimeloyl-ACP methyl ester carboxylesterase
VPERLRDLEEPAVADASSAGQAKTRPVDTRDLPGWRDHPAVMPTARNGLIQLHWESTGTGTPVLLISGQAMALDAWWRTVPDLAVSFRVLSFDNRDIGRSSRSPCPYVVAQMADDAVAVLDAAGVEKAHVYGISLGGMVAQEVALRHPERVDALVLGATTPGGPEVVLAEPQPLTFFVRVGAMASEEAEWAAVPYNYSTRTRRHHGERIAEDIARRLNHPMDTLAYLHQVAAAASHNTIGRLTQISAPTLILHGEDDVIMPPQNGRKLARAIPNAELRTLPGAAHLYTTDEPEAGQYVRTFLEAQTSVGRRRLAA